MKKIFLPLLALVALASCTQNDMDLKGSNDQVEIKTNTYVKSISQDPATRTSFEGTPGTGNEFTAKVLVSATSTKYNTLINATDDVMEYGNNTDAFGFKTTKAYYPADGSTVYISGLYPYGGTGTAAGEWDVVSGSGATAAKFKFTGKEDMMVAGEQSSSKVDATSTGTYPTLTYNHLLTKLVVKAKGDAAAITAFGTISEITLIGNGPAKGTNIPTDVTITLGQNPTTSFGTLAATFPFYIYDVTTNPANPAQKDEAFTGKTVAIPDQATYAAGLETAYSMVAPTTVATPAGSDPTLAAYVLNVKTEHSPANGFEVPVILKKTDASNFTGNTAGKSFTVNLTFKASEIMTIVAVGTWTSEGDSDIDIQ